jgi:lactate dehydrogenase-like 2-hydroxyacid dehydrogenase
VVNAPTANTVAAAEHGIALLCTLSRNVSQADASMKAGKWERNKYVGVSLVDKTLCIMGFGKVGRRAASRGQSAAAAEQGQRSIRDCRYVSALCVFWFVAVLITATNQNWWLSCGYGLTCKSSRFTTHALTLTPRTLRHVFLCGVQVGGEVARRARGLGMIVLAYDPYASEEKARAQGVRLVSFDEALELGDFFSLHMPLTPGALLTYYVT